MNSHWRRTLSLVLVLAVLAIALPGSTGIASAGAGDEVRVQILAINDFHGALESRKVSGRDAGGAAVLAGYLNQREMEAQEVGSRTIRVGDGDLVGASPPVSALLQDEPTIQALGMMGFKYSTVGNHEFDEGVEELLRLQNGGCHEATGCFAGASFQYLAANLVYADSGQPVMPAYAIERVRGIPIGFIGVVLKDTPTIVSPSGVAGLEFLDEATTVNRYVAELKGQGVEAIVVLIHQGGSGDAEGGPISGDIVPVVEAMDDEVDVVISGHSHAVYWGNIGGKLVTQANNAGLAFADVDLVLDPATGDVVEKRAEIVDTFHATAEGAPLVEPDPIVADYIERTAAVMAPRVNQVIATASSDLTRTQNAAGESVLGDLIADAQAWKMDTQIALMNPGGIRAELAVGEVTWGELFTIQPFFNYLVKMRLTGAQIDQALEQQWVNQTTPRMLQVSGISYAWDPAAPVGERVNPASIRVGDQPLDLNGSYTVTVNSFLADGGDNFTVLRSGADKVVGPMDLDGLIDYVRQLPQPFTYSSKGRISQVAR